MIFQYWHLQKNHCFAPKGGSLLHTTARNVGLLEHEFTDELDPLHRIRLWTHAPGDPHHVDPPPTFMGPIMDAYSYMQHRIVK